jgi:hypothetical protein
VEGNTKYVEWWHVKRLSTAVQARLKNSCVLWVPVVVVIIIIIIIICSYALSA